jgi:hypothetical protein
MSGGGKVATCGSRQSYLVKRKTVRGIIVRLFLNYSVWAGSAPPRLGILPHERTVSSATCCLPFTQHWFTRFPSSRTAPASPKRDLVVVGADSPGAQRFNVIGSVNPRLRASHGFPCAWNAGQHLLRLLPTATVMYATTLTDNGPLRSTIYTRVYYNGFDGLFNGLSLPKNPGPTSYSPISLLEGKKC